MTVSYNGKDVYSIGQNEVPINLRIDWAWERINATHPEFRREHWPPEWNDPYQIYEIVVNNVCGYVPKTGAQVMDIGANFGVFTAYCALAGCDVTSYEPHPVAFDMLKTTINRVGIQSRVNPINLAVWKSADHLSFMSNSGHEQGMPWIWSNGSLVVDGVMCPPQREILQVATISLADAVAEKPEWDCVKMDIEGAEFDVLLDAPIETLKKIKYLTIEIHNGQANKQKHDEMARKLETVFSLSGTRDGSPEFSPENRWISLFATRK